MGMRQLEAQILAEAKIVTGNKKLRQKDIAEWSTGTINPRYDETVFVLPKLQISIAVVNAPSKQSKSV